MSAVLVVIALALVGVIVADLASEFVPPLIGHWRERRGLARRHRAEQQLEALRASQELALLAWRARRELYELGGGLQDLQAQGSAPRPGTRVSKPSTDD